MFGSKGNMMILGSSEHLLHRVFGQEKKGRVNKEDYFLFAEKAGKVKPSISTKRPDLDGFRLNRQHPEIVTPYG